MVLVVELNVADLAATRFAASPLGETVKAIQLLASSDPARAEVNRPWLAWARRELDRRPLALPLCWPLIVTGLEHIPEFFLPAPQSQWPALADELELLRATPPEYVRASIARVFAGATWPDSARELERLPAQTLSTIAEELALAHERLIATHWERIRSVLDADIAYRTALLASGGARDLFADLHSDVRWDAGTLSITDARDSETHHVRLGPDGLVLMPSVFTWPEAAIKRATSTQTVLLYPARGAGTVWLGREPMPATTAAALIGQTRARLLELLRSPASTTSLARELGVTPGAMSQHLTVLYRGGLVTHQRTGRSVLYQTSELGLALLAGKLE